MSKENGNGHRGDDTLHPVTPEPGGQDGIFTQLLDAKDAFVTVHLDFSHKPPFSFETDDLPLGPDNHLTFRRGKKNGFKVRFILDDPTYSFGEDKDEALYSTEEARCPTEPGQWSEFQALGITDGGQTLVVHNKNGGVKDFGYTLRIKKHGEEKYKELDPIGSNQNSNE